MSKKKAGELLPLIIAAQTDEDAIGVLNKTLEALYLTSNYTEIVALQDELKAFEKQYREISDQYRSLVVPRSYDDLHNIRVELNFLYRDISDSLTFDTNRLKIHFEETKTVQRAVSMQNLKRNEDVQRDFKASSASALRDIVGLDGDYVEHTACQSISYGLYQNLSTLLNGIRQMVDSIASEEKRELLILSKDQK